MLVLSYLALDVLLLLSWRLQLLEARLALLLKLCQDSLEDVGRFYGYCASLLQSLGPAEGLQSLEFSLMNIGHCLSFLEGRHAADDLLA